MLNLVNKETGNREYSEEKYFDLGNLGHTIIYLKKTTAVKGMNKQPSTFATKPGEGLPLL